MNVCFSSKNHIVQIHAKPTHKTHLMRSCWESLTPPVSQVLGLEPSPRLKCNSELIQLTESCTDILKYMQCLCFFSRCTLVMLFSKAC